MAEYFGQSGDVTINSVAMNITKWSGKFMCDKADVTNAASGGWRVFLAGGLKIFTGECEFVYNTSINSPSSSLPVPFSDTQVSFSLVLGGSTHSISFTGQIYDMSFDNDVSKPITCKCNFESSGSVTFA